MGQVVLFVDDEPKLLESIKRSLHRERYTVEIADGPEEGLKKAELLLPSVIVTDMRMPEMDGIMFLQKVQLICPDAVCMVLSAYSDIEKIMEAINKQHVWRYITKPWQSEELKTAILNALELFDYRQNKKELLLRLEEKNRQLYELNTQLEDRIRERTLQLEEKNEILELIANDSEIRIIMEKVCRAVSRALDTSPVFVDVPFLSITFSNGDIEVPQNLKEAGLEAMRKGVKAIERTHIAIPIVKGHNTLGVLLIPDPEKISGFKLSEVVLNFLSIASISLLIAKNFHETPELNQKINELLGDLQ
jgi:CheY-like chemotaxis protein